MDELLERWQLTLGEPYPFATAGRVWRVERADGTPAVLKIGVPHREAVEEPDALERWNGDGAVRLFERDDEQCALLLERCEPGTPVAASGTEAAMDALVELLPRLWVDPAGFASVEEEAPHLVADVERCIHPRLKDAALAYLRDLVPTQGERVLVNVDLHGENVLSAQRQPWLVIDPKPLAAERELAAAPIVRSDELGHSKRQVLYRLDRLCTDLALDRERAIGWTVAHTVAWSGEYAAESPHLQAIEWLLG